MRSRYGGSTEVVTDVAFVLAACGHERFDGLEEFFDVLRLDGYSGVKRNCRGSPLIGGAAVAAVVYKLFTYTPPVARYAGFLALCSVLGLCCAGV